jgi:hypothetical protein
MLDDDTGFVGVPGVVGMTHTEGFDTPACRRI